MIRKLGLICILLCQLHLLFAQQDTTFRYIPKWTYFVDLVNFQSDYASILLAVERQLDKDFAIHQELGYVIKPESFRGTHSFDQYLGFKGRTEGKVYVGQSFKRGLRDYLAIDLAYQFDQYVMDYRINQGAFFTLENGLVTRSIVGTHMRFGSQRIFSNRKMMIDLSVGLGRSFYNLKLKQDAELIDASNIRTESSLHPYSGNIRVKIGYIAKYMAN